MANEKVLIVEDDYDIGNVLKDYLVSEGFGVQVCNNGKFCGYYNLFDLYKLACKKGYFTANI